MRDELQVSFCVRKLAVWQNSVVPLFTTRGILVHRIVTRENMLLLLLVDW